MLNLINELFDSIKSLLWDIALQVILLIIDILKNIYELFVGLFKLIRGQNGLIEHNKK